MIPLGKWSAGTAAQGDEGVTRENVGWLQSRAQGGWEKSCFVNKVRLKAEREREGMRARQEGVSSW